LVALGASTLRTPAEMEALVVVSEVATPKLARRSLSVP